MKDEEAALPHWGWVKQFTERVSHYGVRIEVREANEVFNEPAPDYLAARMTRHVCFGVFVALVVLRAFGRFEWHELVFCPLAASIRRCSSMLSSLEASSAQSAALSWVGMSPS